MPSPRWLLGLVVGVVACQGGGGVSDPGPTLVVLRQPSVAVVGERLTPAVEVLLEDGAGHPLGGDVMVDINSNGCGWSLEGTTTVAATDGRAVFDDLRIGQVAQGYRLSITSGALGAETDAFDVTDTPTSGRPLVQETTLCPKPNPQKDAESLEYVAVDDVFWLADDDAASIFQIERATGRYRMQIPASRFVEAFPAAGECRDQDNDPITTCSYVNEFEHLAYDEARGLLYVMNTVNSAQATPQEDRPAIFRLRRDGCADCWGFDAWQPLPGGAQYEGLVLIDGELHVAVGRQVYRYSFDQNRVLSTDAAGDPLPPTYMAQQKIERLHYDGTFLWAILDTNVLHKIELSTETVVASYGIQTLGLSLAKGVEFIDGRLYVLDGTLPNAVYVFRAN